MSEKVKGRVGISVNGAIQLEWALVWRTIGWGYIPLTLYVDQGQAGCCRSAAAHFDQLGE